MREQVNVMSSKAKIQRKVLTHLSGGLRADMGENKSLRLSPVSRDMQALTELGLIFPNGWDNPLGLFNKLGLNIIGTEELAIDGDYVTSIWHPSYYGKCKGIKDVAHIWYGIANAARTEGDQRAEELAKCIAFSLQAALMRLRDLSNEYNKQQKYALTHQLTEDHSFENLEIFDLLLAAHSFLAEISGVREFLANFISEVLLKTKKLKMNALYQHYKKNDPSSKIGQKLIAAHEEKDSEWLSKLGQLRNDIMHDAPLYHLRRTESVEQMLLRVIYSEIGNDRIPRIYCPLPENSTATKLAKDTDVLNYMHLLSVLMSEFAAFIASESGFSSKGIVLTEDMILSIEKVEVEDVKP